MMSIIQHEDLLSADLSFHGIGAEGSQGEGVLLTDLMLPPQGTDVFQVRRWSDWPRGVQ